jgi:CHAT domain-containing protein
MPVTPELPDRPPVHDLPATTREAEFLGSDSLIAANATIANVRAALRAATWVHFACHAFNDPMSPSRNRLLLHDGDLDIAQISQLRLENAMVAYLSACATAQGGLRQADEVITVASACQLAGFQHVIGTLWPIDDATAARAAKLFYDALPDDGDPSQLCTVLHRTTRKLRDRSPDHPQRWAQLVHIGP